MYFFITGGRRFPVGRALDDIWADDVDGGCRELGDAGARDSPDMREDSGCAMLDE